MPRPFVLSRRVSAAARAAAEGVSEQPCHLNALHFGVAKHRPRRVARACATDDRKRLSGLNSLRRRACALDPIRPRAFS